MIIDDYILMTISRTCAAYPTFKPPQPEPWRHLLRFDPARARCHRDRHRHLAMAQNGELTIKPGGRMGHSGRRFIGNSWNIHGIWDIMKQHDKIITYVDFMAKSPTIINNS